MNVLTEPFPAPRLAPKPDPERYLIRVGVLELMGRRFQILMCSNSQFEAGSWLLEGAAAEEMEACFHCDPEKHRVVDLVDAVQEGLLESDGGVLIENPDITKLVIETLRKSPGGSEA